MMVRLPMWGSSTADAEGDGGLRVPVAAECAAAQSFLPRLVPQSSLLAANARLDQSSSVAQTFGPVIAGALVTALGAPLAVLLDALSYLASGAAVASIRPSEVNTATRDQSLGLRHTIELDFKEYTIARWRSSTGRDRRAADRPRDVLDRGDLKWSA